MAKMFYTMEETKVALDRTEDEIKTLSREGKLREFRDGPRLMFKADQVDALKGTLASGDRVAINDSGAPIALADSKSGTSSGSASGIPMADSRGSMSIKDDTGMGSVAGGSRSGSGGSGVNIFATDDADNADPSAQTAITPASESANLEAVGSGSGLLDLTRESDDTSLGAVLDEISPGKRDPGGTKSGTATGVAMTPGVGGSTGSPMAARTPVYVTRADSTAPFFGGLAAGAAILSLFALWVLSAAVNGARIPMVETFAQKGLLIIFAGGIVLSLITGAIGFGLGKVMK